MDFSRNSAVEADGTANCAHAQRRGGRKNRHIRGPFRLDQQAAQEDLESMRGAASGMSREEGFAAMEAEANVLKEGKAPRGQGNIEHSECHKGSYRLANIGLIRVYISVRKHFRTEILQAVSALLQCRCSCFCWVA